MTDPTERAEPPRFVLVRGLAREAGHWHEFDRWLVEGFPGATVERVDLAGNGARWRETTPWSIEAMAADLRARVWASDRRAPVLIAVSLGAMVCLDWLRRWPADGVVGLVAINTSVGGLCRPWERMQVPAMIEIVRTLALADPIARELAILALTTSSHRHDLALAEQHASFQRERPIQRRNVLRQLGAASRFRLAPGRMSTPTLLLHSLGDRLVDPRCAGRLAAGLGAALAVHPSAGHDVTLDDPGWCVAETQRWLSTLEQPDA